MARDELSRLLFDAANDAVRRLQAEVVALSRELEAARGCHVEKLERARKAEAALEAATTRATAAEADAELLRATLADAGVYLRSLERGGVYGKSVLHCWLRGDEPGPKAHPEWLKIWASLDALLSTPSTRGSSLLAAGDDKAEADLDAARAENTALRAAGDAMSDAIDGYMRGRRTSVLLIESVAAWRALVRPEPAAGEG